LLLLWSAKDGVYRAAVIVTRDNWRTVVAVAAPGDGTQVFALPGGGAAVLPQPEEDFGVTVPFLLRPDGRIAALRISAAPDVPSSRGFLVPAPDHGAAGSDAVVWVVDPQQGRLFPASSQPCQCGRFGSISDPEADVDGTVHVLVYRQLAGDREEVQVAQTQDQGVTWQRRRTDAVKQPSGRHSRQFYGYFAAGPDQLLALAAFEHKDPDDEYSDLLLRDLLITEDERAWRTIALRGGLRGIGGLAFTSTGTLVLADEIGKRLWQLPRGGTTLEPVTEGPTMSSFVTSGSVLIARKGRRTLSVSTDGLTWTDVTPGLTDEPETQ
jgi:hypothetical protein